MQEDHGMGWVVSEQLGNIANVSFAKNHVNTPQEWHYVEHKQLERIVEALQLELGQMKPFRDFL